MGSDENPASQASHMSRPVAGMTKLDAGCRLTDEFVEVGGLLGGQAMETQVPSRMSRSGVPRKDRKARSTELSTLAGSGP